MKRKIVAILTGLLLSATAVSGLAAVPAYAASVKLADGTSSPENTTFVYCFVRTGTTSKVLVMDAPNGAGGYNVFNVILDKNTVFNNVKYLTPTDEGAAVRDIIGLDIYLDTQGQWHAADLVSTSLNNQKFANSVEVGTSLAQDVAGTTTTTNTNTQKANVKVVRTVSVEGTVTDKSSGSTVYLNAGSNGTMVFKVDSATDMSNGKILMPGYKYKIDFYNGGDGYNHIAKVADQSGHNVGTGNGVSTTTVYKDIPGTVSKETTPNTLYLKQDAGGSNTIIKIDVTTDTTKCPVVKVGQKVTVTFAPGPDGYQHAVSIVDGTESSKPEGSMGDTGKLENQVLAHGYGTFTSDSTDDVAIIGIGGQNYKMRLDSGSKGTNVPCIVPGWSYSVDYYYGSDGYYHIQNFTEEAGHSGSKNPSLDTKSTHNFSGTIQKETVANRLYLKQSDGSVVQIKLDVTTDNSKCRVLRTNRSVTVHCTHGNDGYWHATSFN